jgi:hypothetical protein
VLCATLVKYNTLSSFDKASPSASVFDSKVVSTGLQVEHLVIRLIAPLSETYSLVPSWFAIIDLKKVKPGKMENTTPPCVHSKISVRVARNLLSLAATLNETIGIAEPPLDWSEIGIAGIGLADISLIETR